MYAVTKFAAGSDEIISKAWGNFQAPFDWDPNPNENVQYGNGNNNAPGKRHWRHDCPQHALCPCHQLCHFRQKTDWPRTTSISG